MDLLTARLVPLTAITAATVIGCATGSLDDASEVAGAGGHSSTVVTVAGPGPGSAGSGTSASSGSASGCDVFTAGACGDCIEGQCCGQVEACGADVDCSACLDGTTTSGCSSNAPYVALAKCAVSACGPVVVFVDGDLETPGYWTITSNPCHYAPPQWECEVNEYDESFSDPANAVCNCECGVLPDPDCGSGGKPSDCAPGYSCNAPSSHCPGCFPDDAGCQ